jgi:hypothetical protein
MDVLGNKTVLLKPKPWCRFLCRSMHVECDSRTISAVGARHDATHLINMASDTILRNLLNPSSQIAAGGDLSRGF